MEGHTRKSVYKVLELTFPSTDGDFPDEWGPEEIEGWDSMGHLNLIMALGEKFDISFEFEEVMAIEKVGDIFSIIEKKGVK